MKLTMRSSIHQPLSMVFDYISDPRNEPEWNADLLAVDNFDAAAWGPGASCTMIFRQQPDSDEPGPAVGITVTEFEPERSYAFRSEHGWSKYLFRGNAERTKILFETEVPLPGLMMKTFKRAAVKRSLEARLERNFLRLKEVLESYEPPPDVLEGPAEE